MGMVDAVVRALLKLALIAVLSVVLFYILGAAFVAKWPPHQYPQYGNSFMLVLLASAVVAFFAMAFYAFRKRRGQ